MIDLPLPTPPVVMVRPARLTDAAALQRACWPDRSLSGVAEFLQRVEKYRARRRGLGVAATVNDVVCGFGMLTLWPRTAEISDLIVAPDQRSRGVGTAVIEHLASVAQEMNANVLEIGAALANRRALALYRRLGFCDHHTVQIDLGDGAEPVIYLEKRLAPG